MGQVVRGGEQFETAIAADYRGQIIRRGIDSGEVDAFARKRVSQPYTLFDSALRYDKRADVWNETIDESVGGIFNFPEKRSRREYLCRQEVKFCLANQYFYTCSTPWLALTFDLEPMRLAIQAR